MWWLCWCNEMAGILVTKDSLEWCIIDGVMGAETGMELEDLNNK